jgi:hypothetical protein
LLSFCADWFEFNVSIGVYMAFRVYLFWVIDITWKTEYKIWEYQYTPTPIPELAAMNADGGLTLAGASRRQLQGDIEIDTGYLSESGTPDALECISKGGGAGSEDLQCWQPDSPNPIIQNFKGVSRIGSGGTRRLLQENEMNTSSLSESTTSFSINCVQSDVDVG